MEKNEKIAFNQAEYETKLKANLKLLISQLKFGCYRTLCYNIGFCKKSFEIKDYKNDKEILTDCLKLVKESKNIEDMLCTDFRNIVEKEDVESYIMNNFIYSDYNNVKFSAIFQNKLNLKLAEIVVESNEIDFAKKLVSINEFFSYFIKKYSFANKNENLLKYLVLIYIKVILIISHKSDYFFCHESNTKLFYDLFYQFNYLFSFINPETKLQIYESNFFSLFKDNANEHYFLNMIQSFHTFLTVFLFYTENVENKLKILNNFLKIFEIMYQINKEHDIVSKDEFSNEKMNTDIDIKEECYRFLDYTINKEDKNDEDRESEYFTFIHYSFLLSASHKSYIIKKYNIVLQNKNSYQNSISNILNYGLDGIYLIFKINRDNIVKDTLDIIINSSLNFKKELKVNKIEY